MKSKDIFTRTVLYFSELVVIHTMERNILADSMRNTVQNTDVHYARQLLRITGLVITL